MAEWFTGKGDRGWDCRPPPSWDAVDDDQSNEVGKFKGDVWGANKEKKMKDDEADFPLPPGLSLSRSLRLS